MRTENRRRRSCSLKDRAEIRLAGQRGGAAGKEGLSPKQREMDILSLGSDSTPFWSGGEVTARIRKNLEYKLKCPQSTRFPRV
ncbi:hypothetical protein COCON_G00089720 [Conger conger]|uniref:Uncharacterized protein n=1 Tax=Conger conger TaxID=82655 RepID=A0A9Q1DKS5_CONCO|nr:hypothetical protein COCON_G00089720 [Conger conger]